MLTQKLSGLIAESMKAGNFLRTETLRMLSSSFNYERIALQHDLTPEEEIAVIRKQAKQRRDSIEAYTKAGAIERAKKEEDELQILQEFLPPEMSEEDLDKIITETINSMNLSGPENMGKIIGAVKSIAPDADGGRIAQLVKAKLSQ